ncbi:hypothetical protein CRE_18737 [Caenorhabditis remanei]|uniref:Nuclear receptor domain-containing protein n=1 Tax=Caenorhabditis remanei TaxID=31234 RepID=E3LJQ6_CAERE|nr:hypothetical protein CRE_18737 [Caenorhabditis remanei]
MPDRKSCLICNSPYAKYHFGAISCRACAAFFRRCATTKKFLIFCNCLTRRDTQYPCRLCRMEKCVAAGMQESLIRGSRDVNNQVNEDMKEGKSTEFVGPRVQCGIKLRSVELITQTTRNYSNLETIRSIIFSNAKQNVTLHEFSLEIKTESKLVWKLCEASFLEFDKLNKQDKKTLFSNFHTKWNVLEMGMKSAKNKDPYNNYSPSGARAKPIKDFYTSTKTNEKERLSDDDKKRWLFEPIWRFRTQNVLSPLAALKFEPMENMALFGILLWDPGYTNVSDDLAEKCYAMRKIILNELSCYFEENETDENRFFETMDALRILERAEEKCQQELELCGMYNVAVDEEMKNMAMSEKY